MSELTTLEIIKDRLTHDQYIGWLLGGTIEAQCALNEVEDKSGIAERLVEFANELNKELNNAGPDCSPSASCFPSSNEAEKEDVEVALQHEQPEPKKTNKRQPISQMLVLKPVNDGTLSPKRQSLYDTFKQFAPVGTPLSRKELQARHCAKTGMKPDTVVVAITEMLRLGHFELVNDKDLLAGPGVTIQIGDVEQTKPAKSGIQFEVRDGIDVGRLPKDLREPYKLALELRGTEWLINKEEFLDVLCKHYIMIGTPAAVAPGDAADAIKGLRGQKLIELYRASSDD